MHIGLVRRDFRLYGGAERFTARFLEALRRHGEEVTLIARRWEGLPSDVRVVRVPVISGGAALRTLSFALFSAHRARRLSLDLVHSFDRILQQDLYRAGEGVHREWLRRRRAHLPRLTTLLDPLRPMHRVILALERRIFQQGGARLIVANSEQVASEIAQHYAPLSAPVRVVRNGVDLEHFHPSERTRLGPAMRARLGVGEAEPVLFFLGSGFTRKGLGPLLLALGRLPARRRRPYLLVAGKGRTEPYLALARRLGIEPRVRFLGVVADPLPLYAAADAFVLPSLYDPSSNACLEAMAVGLPVITTRANGASELIEDGREGWVVDDPQDVQGLADRLRRLEDPGRVEMGRRARARVEAYPWDRHLQEILALYSSLALPPR